MRWTKSHQVLNYSLFLSVAFFLFLLLGPSSSCSAVSQSYTITYQDIQEYTDSYWVWYKGSSATESRSAILDFRPVYVEYTYTSEGGGSTTNVLQIGYNAVNSNTNILAYGGAYNFNIDFSHLVDIYGGSFVLDTYKNQLRYFVDREGRSVTFTFYDTIPEGCPDPDPCPEIPDDSQTLLDIKKAVLYIPATLLVIYFFYVMYSWYIGGKS